MSFMELAELIGAVATIGASLRWVLSAVGKLPDLTTFPGFTHSFSHEIAAIVPIAILVNLVGALVAIRDQTIFLDMVGTLIAAIVLGPWWGALIGLSSGMIMYGMVNVLQLATALDFLPFAMVQVAGAFYWGLVSRAQYARPLLSSSEESIGTIVRSILLLGVGGGVVTGVTSGWVYEVVVSGAEPTAELSLGVVLRALSSEVILTEIAGKLSCVVIAALLVRSLFPIFLRASTHRLEHAGVLPVIGLFGACSVYAFVLFEARFSVAAWSMGPMFLAVVWPLALPVLFVLGELRLAGKKRDVADARGDRMKLYRRLDEVARPADEAFRLAAVISILASFLVVALGNETDSDARGLALRLVAVVGFLLIVAWGIEIAGRHNRLDQLLRDEEQAPSGHTSRL